MDWVNSLLVVGVGIIAGFINTLAGSGSIFALWVLIFIGLPANVANGTNRIAILLQSIVAVNAFKKHKQLDVKQAWWLSIPAILGSIVGASLALKLDEKMMRQAIGVLLIIMFFLILYKPEQWIKGKSEETKEKPTVLQFIIFFAIGVYGGFIQVGVGFFLLAGLVLGVGLDLVKANAAKVFITLFFTIFALAVFMYNNQVNYKIGFVLAVGNIIGTLIATKFAFSWGPKFVRYFLLVIIVFASLELFGIFDFLK